MYFAKVPRRSFIAKVYPRLCFMVFLSMRLKYLMEKTGTYVCEDMEISGTYVCEDMEISGTKMSYGRAEYPRSVFLVKGVTLTSFDFGSHFDFL